jgi:hypothetical protein
MVLAHHPDGRTRSIGRIPMDTQGFVAGPLSVLCIPALVMGTASAAVITSTDSTSNPDTRPVQHPLSPDAIMSSLEERGVDVTGVGADPQNGDTAAVKAWLETYFQTHEPAAPEGSAHSSPDLTNSTRQERFVTRLEERGVNVTEARADLQKGDTSAVKTWIENYLHAHEGETPAYHHSGEAGPGCRTDTGL